MFKIIKKIDFLLMQKQAKFLSREIARLTDQVQELKERNSELSQKLYKFDRFRINGKFAKTPKS